MKKEDALDVMEHIGSDIIEEAAEQRSAGAGLRRTGYAALAACLCICMACAVKMYKGGLPAMTGDPMKMAEAPQQNAQAAVPGEQDLPADQQSGPAVTKNAEDWPSEAPGEGAPGPDVYPYEAPDPASVSVTEQPAQQNEVFMPFEGPAPESKDGALPDIDVKLKDVRPMLDSCDSSLNGDAASVENGSVVMTGSLRKAVDMNGADARYRVVVDIFKDGILLDPQDAEVRAETERLSKEGLMVAFETVVDKTGCTSYFTLHAEADQLLSFPAEGGYGYLLSFYGEYPGLAPAQSADMPVFNGNFNVEAEYPADLLDIYQKIVDDMAAGELPYLDDAVILGKPLRIQVLAATGDEALLKDFIQKYDPQEKYLSIDAAKD